MLPAQVRMLLPTRALAACRLSVHRSVVSRCGQDGPCRRGRVTGVDQTVGIHVNKPERLWRYLDCAADDAYRNKQVEAFSSLVYLLGLVLPETVVATCYIQRVCDRNWVALSVCVTTPGP